jgi:septum formation inhibitor MinC
LSIVDSPGVRIFCSRIEAELLAIDGYYRTIDDLEGSLARGPFKRGLKTRN